MAICSFLFDSFNSLVREVTCFSRSLWVASISVIMLSIFSAISLNWLAEIGKFVVGADLDAVGKIPVADLFQAVLEQLDGLGQFPVDDHDDDDEDHQQHGRNDNDEQAQLRQMISLFSSLERPKRMRPQTVSAAATLTGRLIR